MPDLSHYKVGEVLSLEDCGGGKGKSLRACRVNVGDPDHPLTVVTAAANVRQGSRLAVAPVGATIVNEEGEEITVTATTVGGVLSQGIFCDSRMLGWSGGAVGVAAQMPASLAVGQAPPPTKPRPHDGGADAAAALPPPPTAGEGLFAKKLTKEEKKKLAEERRQARKAAKEAQKGAAEPDAS